MLLKRRVRPRPRGVSSARRRATVRLNEPPFRSDPPAMSLGQDPTIRYRGHPVRVRPGDSLARALARRGVGSSAGSVRYHRPRSPFCGVGYCTNCLVRVNGRPNARACQYAPSPGDSVRSENAWPSPSFDVLGALDLVFARGIDTLHGFTRPRWAVPTYQRVVRRLAGFGTLADPSAGLRAGAGVEREADLLILGGGASGGTLSRCLALGDHRTLLVDRERVPHAIPGAEVLDRTTAVFLPPPDRTAPYGFQLLAARSDGVGIRIPGSPGGRRGRRLRRRPIVQREQPPGRADRRGRSRPVTGARGPGSAMPSCSARGTRPQAYSIAGGIAWRPWSRRGPWALRSFGARASSASRSIRGR